MTEADASVVLKFHNQCVACKMKMYEMLSSIAGVYSVTIDAENGLATIAGEVDPNRLLKTINRNTKHAEIKSVKLNSPALRPNYYSNNTNHYGYGYGNYGYGAIDQGQYGYRDLSVVPQGMYHEGPHIIHPHPRTSWEHHPSYYGSNYNNYYGSNYGYGGHCGHHNPYGNCCRH